MKSRSELLAAIRTLRLTQLINLTPISDELLKDEQTLQRYFESDFESETDIEFEKIVVSATTRTVFDSKWISDDKKATVAIAQSKAVLDLFRYVKTTSAFQKRKLTAEQYQNRIEADVVAKKVNAVKKLGKTLVNTGVKIGISALIPKVAAVVGVTIAAPSVFVVGVASFAVVQVVDAVIPKETKEKIKEKAQNVVLACVDKAKSTIKEIKEQSRPLKEKLESKISKVIEKTKQTFERVGESFVHAGEKVKEVGKRTWEAIKRKSGRSN